MFKKKSNNKELSLHEAKKIVARIGYKRQSEEDGVRPLVCRHDSNVVREQGVYREDKRQNIEAFADQQLFQPFFQSLNLEQQCQNLEALMFISKEHLAPYLAQLQE